MYPKVGSQRHCQDRGFAGTYGLLCTPKYEYFQLETLPECRFYSVSSTIFPCAELSNQTLCTWYTCCCYKEPMPVDSRSREVLGLDIDQDGRVHHFNIVKGHAFGDIPYYMTFETVLRTSCLTLFLLVLMRSAAMRFQPLLCLRRRKQQDGNAPTRSSESTDPRIQPGTPSESHADRAFAELKHCWSFTGSVVMHDLTLLCITIALGLFLYPMFIDRWMWLDVFPFALLDMSERLSFLFFYFWLALVTAKIVKTLVSVRRATVSLSWCVF